eukprot:SAG11_NODE_20595_length_442_cov_0.752187_1_plen_63_part_00
MHDGWIDNDERAKLPAGQSASVKLATEFVNSLSLAIGSESGSALTPLPTMRLHLRIIGPSNP